MDDFLHNLRSGKLKQQGKPNRQPNSQHASRGQRQPTINRRNGSEIPTQLINSFKETLGSINKSLKNIADSHESLAKIEKRNAKALETIADGLQSMFGHSDNEKAAIASDSLSSQTKRRSRKLNETEKEALAVVIKSMRDSGDGWEKIARTITTLGYPTVSGRWQWRGVSVKNFYDKLAAYTQ